MHRALKVLVAATAVIIGIVLMTLDCSNVVHATPATVRNPNPEVGSIGTKVNENAVIDTEIVVPPPSRCYLPPYPIFSPDHEIEINYDDGRHGNVIQFPLEEWQFLIFATNASGQQVTISVTYVRPWVDHLGYRIVTVTISGQSPPYCSQVCCGWFTAQDTLLNISFLPARSFTRLNNNNPENDYVPTEIGRIEDNSALRLQDLRESEELVRERETRFLAVPSNCDHLYNKVDQQGHLIPWHWVFNGKNLEGIQEINVDGTSNKNTMWWDGVGHTDFHGLDPAFRYDNTNVHVSGTITRNDGTADSINGTGWLAHYWGGIPAAHDVQWASFMVQLDDGSEIFVTEAWDAVFHQYWGSWGGGLHHYDHNCVLHKQLDYTINGVNSVDEDGHLFWRTWTIQQGSSADGIRLTVDADYAHQIVTMSILNDVLGPHMWAGSVFVSGTIGGRPVHGRGYVQQTYFRRIGSEGGSDSKTDSVGNLSQPQPPADDPVARNYPNPFNPTTEIRYTLPHSERVTLRIYDMLGREVARPVDGAVCPAGENAVRFDGTNCTSGTYFYVLSTPSFTACRRMKLVK